MRFGLLAIVLGVVLAAATGVAHATSFPNSLWLGTDNTSIRSVLNTDTSGALLRSFGPIEATGLAIDLNSNIIYFGDSGGTITPRSLDTLAVVGPSLFRAGFWEGMTFDGTNIVRTTLSGDVWAFNPSTNSQTFLFNPKFGGDIGIAWDGTGFWISNFAGQQVQKFDPSGNPIAGTLFNVGFTAGGLAFDPLDNTLWIGTFSQVYKFSTSGTKLGSFNVPVADGRFVDGLAFQGVPNSVQVPEPPSALLLGGGLAGILMLGRRRLLRGA